MHSDVTDLRAFYTASLGQVTQRFVGAAIGRFWRDVSGLRILGLGYATPYLAGFADRAERQLAFMPATQGVVRWPPTGPAASALVDPTAMPLPDAAVDRVLLVHGLEPSDSPESLLAEIWRILAPAGRLILVVPNRRGLWARLDTTPFGEGRPYSRSQLRALLRNAMFSPEGWIDTLFVPPIRSRVLLRGAVAWERVGLALALPVHGVHVIEATKLWHRPIAIRSQQRERRRNPVLVPVPATRDVLPRP